MERNMFELLELDLFGYNSCRIPLLGKLNETTDTKL